MTIAPMTMSSDAAMTESKGMERMTGIEPA
jgi:hypothetical protein